jgi:hypothetical protein
MSYLFFRKAYNSVRREVLYNIITDLDTRIKLVRLIKMCLYETYTYSKFLIGEYFTDIFPAQNGLKQGDASSSFLFVFALEYAIGKVPEKTGMIKIKWDPSISGLYRWCQTTGGKYKCHKEKHRSSIKRQ